jgi:hypothetical protein
VGHNLGTEIFGEHPLAVGFDFAEGNGSVSLSSGCEGEAPDAAEEVEVRSNCGFFMVLHLIGAVSGMDPTT